MTFLTDLAEAWRPWAWGASWQLALLVALISGLLLGARRIPPRLRYALWLLVTIKVFLPPSLGLVFGIGTWGIEPVRQRAAAWVVPADQSTATPTDGARPAKIDGMDSMNRVDRATAPFQQAAGAVYSAPSAPLPSSAPTLAPSSPPSVQSPSSIPSTSSVQSIPSMSSSRSFSRASFALWLLGVAGFAAFVLTRYARFSRRLRDAEEVTEGPLRIELERLAALLGPTGPADCLFVALDSASPYVVDYPDGEATKKAHYLLRWVFEDGEKGPWSETVSATIGG